MISYLVIVSTAVIVSGLTLYSGFGLGTLLMPAFALFFPVEIAVAATAVVHGANNIFKILTVGKGADRSLVLSFGIPAVLAAFAGAGVLAYLSGSGQWGTYTIGSRVAVITPIKLIMGILMFVFALLELIPSLRRIRFERKYLVIGGILSGFFGGLSGHQGALRSAFLAKTGVSTQAFVGTNAWIGFLVDMTRIVAYAGMFFLAGTKNPIGSEQWPLIVCGTIAAFAGVWVGKKWLHKVTMSVIQTVTGVILLVIAIALGSGIL
jgi:uncharacterized membrane protein YfcA